MAKCYLTKSERAKLAMQAAMGLPVLRCGSHSDRGCILPVDHSCECVTSVDVPECLSHVGEWVCLPQDTDRSWCMGLRIQLLPFA